MTDENKKPDQKLATLWLTLDRPPLTEEEQETFLQDLCTIAGISREDIKYARFTSVEKPSP